MDLLSLASSVFPKNVITMKSALVVHGLADRDENDPLDLCLAPFQKKIKDEQIRYWILPKHLFEIGSFYLDKGDESYLIYDLPSLCAQYLYFFVTEKINRSYFLEGMGAIKKALKGQEKEKAMMKEHLYLYPQARVLMSLFDEYILKE